MIKIIGWQLVLRGVLQTQETDRQQKIKFFGTISANIVHSQILGFWKSDHFKEARGGDEEGYFQWAYIFESLAFVRKENLT